MQTGEVHLRYADSENEGGRLAVVTIANPAKLNAMSRHMWQQLRCVFNSISTNFLSSYYSLIK